METPLDINLRPSGTDGTLRQTGRPAEHIQYLTDADSGELVSLWNIHFIPGDNPVRGMGVTIRFVSRGNELLAVNRDSFRVVDTLPSAPVGILACEGGVTVLLSEGYSPVRYIRKGLNGWKRAPEAVRLPAPFALTRTDSGQLTAVIPSKTLKGSYNSRSPHLTVADADLLGNAMGEAYVALSDAAMAGQKYIEPVMARYRIRDKFGEPVYTSAPIVITPDAVIQGGKAEFTLTGDNFNVTSETVLRAEAFTLTLTPCVAMDEYDGWGDIIGSVDILVSPQLHLYLHGASPLHRLRNFSATDGGLDLWLPGVPDTPEPAAPGTRFHAMVTALLDRADIALRPENFHRHDTLSEIAELCRILDTKISEPSPDDRILASLAPPHTFAATTAVSAGNATLWGNLHAIPFGGYSAAELAAGTGAGSTAVPAVSCVKFSDGSSVVQPCTLSGSIPATLSPLLVYPSPDATEISVSIGTRTVTRPLRASPGGKWAYYLDPSAVPVTLDTVTDTFVIPAVDAPVRHYPDAVVATGRGTSRSPTALVRCAGEVTAITPTALPVSSWDFARGNFYAFTLGGSCALTVNSKGNALSAARLDSRAVGGREGVAVTPHGVMAVADGELLRLNSNRVVTVLTGITADRIGWSQPGGDGFDRPASPSGELWCVTSESGEILITSHDGKHSYLRDDVEVTEMLSTPEGLLGLTADLRLVNLSVEEGAESTVRCIRRFPMPGKPSSKGGRFVRLTLPVYGVGLKGSIDIRADNGLGIAHSCSLTRFDIDGDLNSPLTAVIPTPVRTHISIHINLTGHQLTVLM